MRQRAFYCCCLLTTLLLLSGTARAEILHVPAGHLLTISGNHTYDAVLIEGWLRIASHTQIVTDSFVLAPGGEIRGTWSHGGNGTDSVWLGIGQGYSTSTVGKVGSPGLSFEVWSRGLLDISGHLTMPGGNGGQGGDGSVEQPARRGGDGGRGGTIWLEGRDVVLGEGPTMVAVGGLGGDGGNAPSVSPNYPNGGRGGDGGDGGGLTINYIDSFSYAGTGGYLSRVNVSGNAGGDGGSGALLGNDGANGVSGSTGNAQLNQVVLGDFNHDGVVNTEDINPFILALTDVYAYANLYSIAQFYRVDPNLDGNINTEDINPFIAHLTGSGDSGIIPEPASFALLGMGASALLRRR
jgi:hypothetical protein